MGRYSQSQDRSTAEAVAVTSALLLSVICTVAMLGWALWRVRFGIDFSDEGFYLVWISDPFKYSVSLTQFGYIYHPLYALVNGDIAALRQANLLITYCLTWAATFGFLGVCFKPLAGGIFPRIVVAAAIATASLIFFRQWIPTPSYNSLSYQAVMLVTMGLMLTDRKLNLRSLAGWALLGIGGWLAFMAKPTVAAALGASSIVYLLTSRKATVAGVGLSVITCALSIVLYAQLVDGSLVAFFERINEGLRRAQLLSPDYRGIAVFRIDDFSLSKSEWFLIAFGSVILAAQISLAQPATRLRNTLWILVFISLCFLIGIVIAGDTLRAFVPTLAIEEALTPIGGNLWVHLVFWAVPLGIALNIIVTGRLRELTSNFSSTHWSLLFLMLFLPYGFALGTGSNYWFYQGLAGVFWVYAGLVIFSSVSPQGRTLELMSVAIGVQFFSAVIFFIAVQDPYYQPGPLRQADYEIDFGRSGSKLILPRSFGQYVSDALEQARNAGFEKGMPMIDLTGHSPGTLYALGASSTGAAWIYGGYDKTKKSTHVVAGEILRGVGCDELSRAWLLVEPNGPVNISPEVLKIFGADFDNDYKAVGAFVTRPSVGGFPQPQVQQIFMPVRTGIEANKRCSASRGQQRDDYS